MSEERIHRIIAVAVQTATPVQGEHKFDVVAENVVRALEAAGFSIVPAQKTA